MAPDVRVINLETSVIHSAEERAVRDSALRQFLESGSRFIYLDQMNLSSRARSPYLSPDNFNVAVVLEAGLEIVLERHRSRSDKAEEIPESAVVSGYRRLEMLKDQEFDLVVLYEPEME